MQWGGWGRGWGSLHALRINALINALCHIVGHIVCLTMFINAFFILFLFLFFISFFPSFFCMCFIYEQANPDYGSKRVTGELEIVFISKFSRSTHKYHLIPATKPRRVGQLKTHWEGVLGSRDVRGGLGGGDGERGGRSGRRGGGGRGMGGRGGARENGGGEGRLVACNEISLGVIPPSPHPP